MTDPELVERCAKVGREAFAQYEGGDIVDWEQSKAKDAWRVVAEAIIEEANR